MAGTRPSPGLTTLRRAIAAGLSLEEAFRAAVCADARYVPIMVLKRRVASTLDRPRPADLGAAIEQTEQAWCETQHRAERCRGAGYPTRAPTATLAALREARLWLRFKRRFG